MNSSVAISTGVPSGKRYGLMLGVFAGLLLVAADLAWCDVGHGARFSSLGVFRCKLHLPAWHQPVRCGVCGNSADLPNQMGPALLSFGELMTLAYFPFAIGIFLVIFGYGRSELFYWLSPEPGEHLSSVAECGFSAAAQPNCATRVLFACRDLFHHWSVARHYRRQCCDRAGLA